MLLKVLAAQGAILHCAINASGLLQHAYQQSNLVRGIEPVLFLVN